MIEDILNNLVSAFAKLQKDRDDGRKEKENLQVGESSQIEKNYP